MTIRMNNLERLTLTEMEEFVAGSVQVSWTVTKGQESYELIERVLKARGYSRLRKGEKGTVRRFLSKVTGFSRAQMTRLIQRWMDERKITRKPARRPDFPKLYTAQDVALLAEVDAAHQDLAGPAVRHLLKRGFQYGDKKFERLANISSSHIYNLRKTAGYRKIRVRVEHTRARQVSIGERRKPEPKGRPGFLRIDTIHQGQHDGQPGVYHINAVDTVTQWEVIGCVETISELHMIPALEAMLHQCPFRIVGFHSDNGSEFINGKVVALLDKLLVKEFTKSRAYKTVDNAQVEGKNGAVVRKLIGYGPIKSDHAEELHKLYTAFVNPYLNFHRPCGFATITTNKRGKRKKTYRHEDYQTPYEKLTSLTDWGKYLKEGISKEMLKRRAEASTDTVAAQRMQNALQAFWSKCRNHK